MTWLLQVPGSAPDNPRNLDKDALASLTKASA